MSRPRKAVPAYSRHKPSGQAVVKLTLPGGGRKTVYLGRYDSPESRREYARVGEGGDDAPAAAVTVRASPGDGLPDPTMNELMLAFMRHAAVHYRRADGTPTSEVGNFKAALRPVKALYGDLPASRFGPRELKAVRDRIVSGGCCRTEVNAQVGRVRRVVKWAAGEGLVPVETHLAMTVVTGLQRGQSAGRESEPVRAVPEEAARAVLPHVLPPVRAMVELQLLTGMRPGEVCEIRPADVDAAGAVWVYRPGQHKLAHRGRAREVVLGPRAQAVLRAFAPPEPRDCYFSPRRAVAGQRAGRAAARKTLGFRG